MSNYKIRIEPDQWVKCHAIEIYIEADGPMVAATEVVEKFNTYVGVEQSDIKKIIEVE